MAGLEGYEPVYRGKPTKPSRNEDNFPYAYEQKVIRPLDVPVPHPLAKDIPSADDTILKKYVDTGCGLVTLITETLLVHPFIVLRRQCQVNPGSTKYHIIPITLIPVVARLHQTQGINTLWKGIGSVLLVNGMVLAIEDFVCKITLWPKEMPCSNSLKAFGQHILLKCVSIGLTTPFYSASLVETVQSEIASESPGILDVFKDGAIRLVEVSNKGRLIPIYALLPPTIAYGVSRYLFTTTVHRITSYIMQCRQKRSQELGGAFSRSLISEVILNIELQSILVSRIMADVLFYPWETVIHRIHLQGTRTIIDNLDTGRSVTPLLTGYSGARDCYSTIISTEGPLGLYKGFGALLLQSAVHLIIVRAVSWILTGLRTPSTPKPKSVQKPSHRTHY
ncbi:mitochondrial outer membrane protein SLC25A46 [Megalopta genalis]|uniref:mitochondrial outer membrane protein SLC25A46 n=1 Tax=Megalopta genalis TaxID=115081 RepID=UPI0014438727|nr:solute carrier family 25 member 46-like [Megalopta genalis]